VNLERSIANRGGPTVQNMAWLPELGAPNMNCTTEHRCEVGDDRRLVQVPDSHRRGYSTCLDSGAGS
jgi:hypothetical protein